MIYQTAAVLNTYFTRRWIMLGLGTGALFVAIGLITVSMAPRRTVEPMFVMQLVALPSMLFLAFLVQQAKWQFVHSRARLMPRYAQSHLGVLGALLAMALFVYPLVASQLLNISLLGILAFVMLLGASVAWAIHTLRPAFVLAYLALFFSFVIPSVSPLWIAHDPALDAPRVALLALGGMGVLLWLRNLSRITEEAEHYVVPVQGNFGASRMEKSEARRVVALAMSRAKLQSWLADRWHDRLASLPAHDERARPRLLEYGFAATSPLSRALFFAIMAVTIGAFQYLVVDWTVASNTNRVSNPAARYGVIGTMAMFCAVAPFLVTQLTAGRKPRLPQELLLPMSRQAFVGGLFRSLAHLALTLAAMGIVFTVGATWLIAPELLTPINVASALIALVAVQPLILGISFAAALIRSTIAGIFVMIVWLYVAIGIVAAVFALGRYVSLTAEAVLALTIVVAGLAMIRLARSLWMENELGR